MCKLVSKSGATFYVKLKQPDKLFNTTIVLKYHNDEGVVFHIPDTIFRSPGHIIDYLIEHTITEGMRFTIYPNQEQKEKTDDKY